MAEDIRIDWQALIKYCQTILFKEGVPENEAYIIADSLVDANLCGIDSHGVSRMAIYLKRLQAGVVEKKWRIKVNNETTAILAVDACNSMGMVTGIKVMEKCIEKAKQTGIGFATVSHSNHYGTAAYFTRLATKENMIGITMTNAPSNIAPWGSFQPYMGTNPIAFGIPRRESSPIILDMAPSVVAMGKVILAAKLGKNIPIGWALDNEGNDTTDAKKGMEGSVIPIGGPKGSGLAMMVDILAGILSGAQFGPHLNNMWSDFVNPQNVGHVFLVIDIGKFIDVDLFARMIEVMIQEIKGLPKKKDISEINLPGEIEQSLRNERMQNGIPLPKTVFDELVNLGGKYGVDQPAILQYIPVLV